ncbi:MAG: murein hydrolase activator EnvC family protein [Candidatus Brocadiales bacterium]
MQDITKVDSPPLSKQTRLAYFLFACMLAMPLIVSFAGCAKQRLKGRPYTSEKLPPTVSKKTGYAIHKVQRGETVWAISKRYRLSPDTLIQLNGIKDVKDIKVGQKLLIPRTYSSPRITSTSLSSKGFIWPLNGKILQRYGDFVGGHKNTGIDIEAPLGQDVLAAKGGKVEVVSENPSGWGKVVVIRHNGGLHTWYAHNSRVFVQEGNWVRQGQVISQAGQSGSVTRPELHFKVFRNDKPVDPLSYLSQ